jgi:hypothetical protein
VHLRIGLPPIDMLLLLLLLLRGYTLSMLFLLPPSIAEFGM